MIMGKKRAGALGHRVSCQILDFSLGGNHYYVVFTCTGVFQFHPCHTAPFRSPLTTGAGGQAGQAIATRIGIYSNSDQWAGGGGSNSTTTLAPVTPWTPPLLLGSPLQTTEVLCLFCVQKI